MRCNIRWCIYSTRLLKGIGKSLYAMEASLSLLCQGHHHYLLNVRWERGILLAERRWLSKQVLTGNLSKCPMKGTVPGQPFIDHNAEGILIAGRYWPPLYLFRSYVACRAH